MTSKKRFLFVFLSGEDEHTHREENTQALKFASWGKGKGREEYRPLLPISVRDTMERLGVGEEKEEQLSGGGGE